MASEREDERGTCSIKLTGEYPVTIAVMASYSPHSPSLATLDNADLPPLPFDIIPSLPAARFIAAVISAWIEDIDLG